MQVTTRRPEGTALRLTALAALAVVTVTVTASATGMYSSQIAAWIYSTQSGLHRALATALASVSEQGAGAAWWLATLSFLYGIFHAAGPGHGKVVLSTYLATHESRVGRGTRVSFGLSFRGGHSRVSRG